MKSHPERKANVVWGMSIRQLRTKLVHRIIMALQQFQEQASLEKGGGPAKLVEGFWCNLFLELQISRQNPSVSLRLTASSQMGNLLRWHKAQAFPLGKGSNCEANDERSFRPQSVLVADPKG